MMHKESAVLTSVLRQRFLCLFIVDIIVNCPFPVMGRGFTICSGKQPGEVMLVFKTQLSGNFLNVELGLPEQQLGTSKNYSKMVYKLKDVNF